MNARSRAGLLGSIALLAALLPAGTAGATSRPTHAPGAGDEAAPVLLMLHSGGFILGSPASLDQAAAAAEGVGFEAVPVAYKLHDLPGAAAQVERIARRYERQGRDVYAYGESAGGLLASMLAEESLSEATAVYSSISDLPAYIRHTPPPERGVFVDALHATRKQIRELSPVNGLSEAPVLALTPVADSGHLNRATDRWAERDPLVSTRDVQGGHLGLDEPDVYAANVAVAMRWLARRAHGVRHPLGNGRSQGKRATSGFLKGA